jgi:CubicO group peptidase (beta-lactamase class C family)
MSLDRARAVVARATFDCVLPGGVVEVGRASGPVATFAEGRLTYDAGSTAASPDTIYDLASLTKVLATATLAMTLVERGALRLDDRVRQWIQRWTGEDRQIVTVRDLLEHCSGLPAHRKYYESRTGAASFELAICDEPLEYVPRTKAVYSDAGFILLGFILERAGGRPLDRQFAAWRDGVLGSQATLRFLPPAEWAPRTAPTEDDPWRGRVLQGEVHDENAKALGGVAGHAGLFGTASAVGACARWWLGLLQGLDQPLARHESAARFARNSPVPASSRALGWDTMRPTSSCGRRLSPQAVGHTGFTGTSLWIDPTNDLYVVFLSNRVHPSRAGEAMTGVRAALHDAVAEDLGLP